MVVSINRMTSAHSHASNYENRNAALIALHVDDKIRYLEMLSVVR